MIEYLPLVLTGLGLTASIFYYTITLRNANKTRETQLILQIMNKMDDFSELWNHLTYIWTWTNIDEFWQKYGPENNITDWIKLFRFSAFIENLGVLVNRGSLDADLLDDIFAGVIIDYWEKYGPVFIDLRARWDMPDISLWTEKMVDKLKEVRKKKGTHTETMKVK